MGCKKSEGLREAIEEMKTPTKEDKLIYPSDEYELAKKEKERRVLCKYCNQPIKLEEFGGVNKEGYFHGNCFLTYLQIGEEVLKIIDEYQEKDTENYHRKFNLWEELKQKIKELSGVEK